MHLIPIAYLVTLIGILIASTQSNDAASVSISVNQPQISTERLLPSKAKRDVRSRESALPPNEIEHTIEDRNDRVAQPSISNRGDVRLAESHTSATIYHGNFGPFPFITQNPRLQAHANTPIVENSAQKRNQFEPQNRIPASDDSTNDEPTVDDTECNKTGVDVRLPENSTSRTIYIQPLPPFLPTAATPTTETNIDNPPFTGLNNQTLGYLEQQLLPSLIQFDPGQIQLEEGATENGSTNNFVGVMNTTTVSNPASKYNVAELHDSKPSLDDWYSQWMNSR